MEARSYLSSLGGIGTVWLRRATIHFLSARLLGVGGRAGEFFTLEISARDVCMACAYAFRLFDVFVSAHLAKAAGCDLCGRAVRHQSILLGNRLLAKRFCRTARRRASTITPTFLFTRA